MDGPTIADLVPFLTDRGRIELDYAFASWRATQAEQRAAAAEARVAELEAAHTPTEDTPDNPT